MTSQSPKPVTHIYREINKGRYKSVRHFQLEDVKNGILQLAETINISENRNCALSKPEYWLKIKQGKNWDKKCLTGLFKTKIINVYKGDSDKRKHLILFVFSDYGGTLKVYYFKNYFTFDLSNVMQFIN